ncbi:MAG: hypothetical protein OXB88_10710 [Bacteriovoracales bacterium]|nr:hypothetical protein [Bacteriovoracales bacterium]
MKKRERQLSPALLLCSLLISFNLGAQTQDPSGPKKQGRLVVFGVSGTLQINQFNGKYDLPTDDDAYVSPRSRFFVTATSGKFFISLGVDAARLFKRHSLDVDKVKMEEFLSDASIQIRNINDQLTAIIIGKQYIPFGQRVSHLPPASSWENPIQNVRLITDTIGFSVELSELPTLKSVVDFVELSVFESSEFDLSVDGGLGIAARLTKIFEKGNLEHEVTVSYAQKENDHLPFREGTEQRFSVGLISESSFSEDFFSWVEWIYFDNHPYYRGQDNQALILGMTSTIFNDKTYWTAEVSLSPDHASNYSVGMWYNVAQKLGLQTLVGGEYRHNEYKDPALRGYFGGKSDDQIGASVRMLFYKTKGKRFGGGKKKKKGRPLNHPGNVQRSSFGPGQR